MQIRGDRFAKWWPVDYHLIGKDILRQHAVYWPAMLMAAGEAPPQHVFAHGFLLVGGEKMSKTRANQIAPADLVADFGVDGYRYHFVADQRFGPDGDFSYEAMVARYNSDLANNFGNLASRVLNMATNYVGGVTPDTREDGPLVDAATTAFATLRECLVTVAQLLAPFTPFIADEIYENLGGPDAEPSVHLTDWPQAGARWDAAVGSSNRRMPR